MEINYVQCTVALLSGCNFTTPCEVNSHLLKVRNTHTHKDRWCSNLCVGSKGTVGEPGAEQSLMTRATSAFCEVSVMPPRVYIVLCIISGSILPLAYTWGYWFEKPLPLALSIKLSAKATQNTIKIVRNTLAITFAWASTCIYLKNSCFNKVIAV